MRVGFLNSSKFKTLFWYRWVTRGKKKPIQRLKKSPTSFSQYGLSFFNFSTLSLTTPETHIKSDPIFRNHRLYNTENQEKKKSPVTHQPPSTADPYQQTPSDFRHRFLCRCYTLSPASSGFLWWLGEREREREERDQWNLEIRIGLGLNEFGFGS